jgi:hypothetical protein
MKKLLISFSLIVTLGISVSAFAQTDPFVGTWKFNREKSTYELGRGPKSETRTIEATREGERVVIHQVAADGSSHDTHYSCNFDGKDCPLGTAEGGTITRKRIDSNTIESTVKKNGKALYTTRLVISKDGKTMTIKAKGKNASGQTFDNDVSVYDKQ